MQQRLLKAERILTFALCNFSAKGGSASGGHFAMLYSPNWLWGSWWIQGISHKGSMQNAELFIRAGKRR